MFNATLRSASLLLLSIALVGLTACKKKAPENYDDEPTSAKAEVREQAKAASPEDAPVEGSAPKVEEKMIPAPDDVAAPPKDAKTTASGLATKVLKKGEGKKHPGPTDQVTVHYTGWTTDGKMFDSSVVRNEPATFPLNRVIAGWTEGVQLMVAGEKRRLWIPEKLAYQGMPAGMLVFDVELLSIASP